MKRLMFLRLEEGKITHHLLLSEPSLSWGPGGDQIVQMVAEAAQAAGLELPEDKNNPFAVAPSFLNYEEAFAWYRQFARDIEGTTKIRFLWLWRS